MNAQDHQFKLDAIEQMRVDVETMRHWASRINGWADQSVEGGWGTHQVEENRKLAAEIHVEADRLNARRVDLLNQVREERAGR